jgi:hypothetical protein
MAEIVQNTSNTKTITVIITSLQEIIKDVNLGTIENMVALLSMPIDKNTLPTSMKNITELNEEKRISLPKVSIKVQSMTRSLDSESTPTLREMVKLLLKIHPSIDNILKDNTYFKGVSEDVASRTLAYTPDTQSLKLNNWSDGTPMPIKKILKQKLDIDMAETIDEAYHNLNKAFVRNLSTEFFNERERDILSARILMGKNPLANGHDFHIAGDDEYANILKPLSVRIRSIVTDELKDAIRLINHLNPISNFESALVGPYSAIIEGNKIDLDLKGNSFSTSLPTVVNSGLKPTSNRCNKV